MPDVKYCVFNRLFLRNPADFTGIILDSAETNILWELCRNGPQSCYRLTRPMEKADILLPMEVLETAGKTGETANYYRDFVVKTVASLEGKGIVNTRVSTENRLNARIVEPTFEGLMLFLRESKNKDGFVQATTRYSRYFHFSEDLEILNEELSKGFVYYALERSVKNCVNLRPTLVKIRPQNLEFTGFLEDAFYLGDSAIVLKEKQEKVARLLQKKKDPKLIKPYIAYLAVHDMLRLRGHSRKDLEGLLPELNSEKELAFFESREISSDPLFRGQRLREFFPEYSTIEYFLTGMFVQNLLWKEIAIENLQKESDYEADM